MPTYEAYLKSNRFGVINNLFQFQTTKCMFSPSKYSPHRSNAPFPSFYPTLLYTVGRIFLDVPQLHRCGPLESLYGFKTGPLDDPRELGGTKSHTVQYQVNRAVVPTRRCSSWLRTAGGSGSLSSIVGLRQPRFVLPQLSSLLAH